MKRTSESEKAVIKRRFTVLALIAGAAAVAAVLLGGADERMLALPVLLCGAPIMIEAAVGLLRDRDAAADVLVSIAMVAAVAIGEYLAAAEVALIMSLGELLEDATIAHARSGIRRAAEMAPEDALVVEGGGAVRKPLSEVAPGDVVRILPGEAVPADGVVVAGGSCVDRSLVTGEPVPVTAAVGDEVPAGAVNMLGSIDIRVTAVGDDSTVGRIAGLLRNADAEKSKIARFADRAAVYIVAGAFSIAAAVYLLTGDPVRSVAVLVVFCPCALVLATPTAIMAAAGNLSKRGVLVKDGGALERMAAVDTVLLDKTGTVTSGDAVSLGFTASDPGADAAEAMRLAASLEALSEHPLGRAVADGYAGPLSEASDFKAVPGFGVSGTVEGHAVAVGSAAFMSSLVRASGVGAAVAAAEARADAGTCTLVAIDGRCVGSIGFSDRLREGAAEAVGRLNAMGLTTVMLTGDGERAAKRAAAAVGASDVVWGCLPSAKLDAVRKLEEEHRVCMVGDGINDAPSLKRADVGVCMGRAGRAMAVEAADIVLMEDDISRLPGLVELSRRTLLMIKAGMAFSMSVNVAAVTLAALGLMGPIAGALVHNAGSLAVVAAAAMLMHYDAWGERDATAATVTAPSPAEGARGPSHGHAGEALGVSERLLDPVPDPADEAGVALGKLGVVRGVEVRLPPEVLQDLRRAPGDLGADAIVRRLLGEHDVVRLLRQLLRAEVLGGLPAHVEPALVHHGDELAVDEVLLRARAERLVRFTVHLVQEVLGDLRLQVVHLVHEHDADLLPGLPSEHGVRQSARPL